MPMNLLLYTGYLVNIPIALEEAARVDGASTWRTFWKIIFPIMKPMHATVAVITALAVWNDVMTPLIIMSGKGANYAAAGPADVPDAVWYELQPGVRVLSAGSDPDYHFLCDLPETYHQRSGKRRREISEPGMRARAS